MFHSVSLQYLPEKQQQVGILRQTRTHAQERCQVVDGAYQESYLP